MPRTFVTTMSQILDYYRKHLGADYHEDKFQFEVEGEPPISLQQLTERLEAKGQSFLFNPDPLVKYRGETPKAGLQFSLLQIEKIPENEKLPGLLLKDGEHHHLLIHHGAVTPEYLQTLRNDIWKKLRHIGCRPGWVTRVSSSVQVLNPSLLKEDSEDVWMKHKNFRFFEDLKDIPVVNDENAIIGKKHRFLCKGGSFLIVAPSGVGKSTLLMQMAMSWSAGRDFFGLKPTRELRCFLLQGENDDGDVAEMAQGIRAGLELSGDEYSALTRNFRMQSQFGMGNHTNFPDLLAELVEVHRPDVFFVDPLFAFLQGNFIEQEFVSENFRRGIDPVLKGSGCILVSTHHTPKPAKEAPRTSGMDFSYSGFGTSELTNWYRAVATLRPEKGKHKTFRFIVAKRGARAGFPDGLNYCLMRHSEKGLFWEKVPGVVIASPDGPLPQDEYDSLKLFVQIRSDFPEFRNDILEKIKTAKKVKSPRRADHYWGIVKKYFIKEGEKYRPLTPEELNQADIALPGNGEQTNSKPKTSKKTKAGKRKTGKRSRNKAPRNRPSSRPSRKVKG